MPGIDRWSARVARPSCGENWHRTWNGLLNKMSGMVKVDGSVLMKFCAELRRNCAAHDLGVLSLLKCVVAVMYANGFTALPLQRASHPGDYDVPTYHCTC